MFDPATHSLKRGLPGTKETVVMLAGLMALNAFAIDAMLPALPDIADWERFEAARLALGPNLSLSQPARRYRAQERAA